MAQSQQHLKRRGGKWHLKLAIPRALRHLYLSSTGKQRTHVEEALGTSDLATANRLKHEVIARWHREFRSKERANAGVLPSVVARQKSWREALREAGEEERETLELVLSDEAEDIEEAALREGLSPADAVTRAVHHYRQSSAKITLREAWEQWARGNEHNPATVLKDNQALRGLLDFMGAADPLPSAVTHKLARDYVRWLNTEAKSARGTPPSKATKEARIAPLRIFWNKYLEHHEYVPLGSNPWRGHTFTGKRSSTQEHPDKKRPYTDAEILALLNGPEMKRSKTARYSKRTIIEIYALAFYTGARLGEVGNRRLRDITHIPGGYLLKIGTAKTDEGVRDIPILHPIPVAILARRIGTRTEPSEQLFAEFKPGGPNEGLAWNVSKALGRYRDLVGLGTATDTHSTRRRFISDLGGRGISQMLIQQYVGHKVPGMTGVYARPTIEGMRAVAEAISYPHVIEEAFKTALAITRNE